jgi:hypothetical protein
LIRRPKRTSRPLRDGCFCYRRTWREL